MAICLSKSLIRNKYYNQFDVACSYVYWMQSGPLCAGKTTRKALSGGKTLKKLNL